MFGARFVLAFSLLIISSGGSDAGSSKVTPPVTKGATYYLSPAGDDSNPGTTSERPWRSFEKVLNTSKPLRAGDTVGLLDGTYTRQTTGLPPLDCHPDGNP